MADPLLARSLKRIGDRAAAGLETALAGQRIVEPRQHDRSHDGRRIDRGADHYELHQERLRGPQAARGRSSLDDTTSRAASSCFTGATSGLGYAAARQLARCGATLVLVGRNADRNERVVAELIEAIGNMSITQVPADMGDLGQVRALAAECWLITIDSTC